MNLSKRPLSKSNIHGTRDIASTIIDKITFIDNPFNSISFKAVSKVETIFNLLIFTYNINTI